VYLSLDMCMSACVCALLSLSPGHAAQGAPPCLSLCKAYGSWKDSHGSRMRCFCLTKAHTSHSNERFLKCAIVLQSDLLLDPDWLGRAHRCNYITAVSKREASNIHGQPSSQRRQRSPIEWRARAVPPRGGPQQLLERTRFHMCSWIALSYAPQCRQIMTREYMCTPCNVSGIWPMSLPTFCYWLYTW
jgi:hypothetical protein